jgi:hypothetical protein
MDSHLQIQGLPLIFAYRTAQCLAVGKDCTMNRVNQFFSTLLGTSQLAAQTTPASAARSLLERATRARGQSRYEAAQLRANAQAMLSVLR